MLRRILFILALSPIFTSLIEFPSNAGYVRGYYRKDGTYVRPHYRSNPISRSIYYDPLITPLPPTPSIKYNIPNHNSIPIPVVPITPINTDSGAESFDTLTPALQPEITENKYGNSCEDVVFHSMKDLQHQRDLLLSIELKKATDTYGISPQNRPYYYLISMSGSSVDSIFNSPQLIRTISRRIIKKCPSISAIAFGRSNSGELYTIGILPSKEVDFFQCVEDINSNFNSLTWGQEYCHL
ncbi:hypothetical protein [Sphaerospermopsis sp. FACHB-1194]|uniref:hypothetical protein n=1 Tax=Sphaerospermopsis sp. FACHB-1194 TaxID=2692862 RepID=UPI0016803351|nr:hypothetical protein [Sphaerospermopsis sp. FACHB-1194]MBD2146190.1 hypothetical protein [Sphaerospermopsis sp. FACHB-1194]